MYSAHLLFIIWDLITKRSLGALFFFYFCPFSSTLPRIFALKLQSKTLAIHNNCLFWLNTMILMAKNSSSSQKNLLSSIVELHFVFLIKLHFNLFHSQPFGCFFLSIAPSLIKRMDIGCRNDRWIERESGWIFFAFDVINENSLSLSLLSRYIIEKHKEI